MGILRAKTEKCRDVRHLAHLELMIGKHANCGEVLGDRRLHHVQRPYQFRSIDGFLVIIHGSIETGKVILG